MRRGTRVFRTRWLAPHLNRSIALIKPPFLLFSFPYSFFLYKVHSLISAFCERTLPWLEFFCDFPVATPISRPTLMIWALPQVHSRLGSRWIHPPSYRVFPAVTSAQNPSAIPSYFSPGKRDFSFFPAATPPPL